MRYHEEVYEGEHEAIVNETLWHRVQDALRLNGRNGGKLVRNKYGALLKGLLHCKPCGCGMMHTYTSKKNRRYRYYVCMNAQKRGWENCPTKSVPAAEIEWFVVDRIRAIGQDDDVLARTLEQARKQSREGLDALQAERRRLERELARHGEEVRNLMDQAGTPGESPTAARLADPLLGGIWRHEDCNVDLGDVQPWAGCTLWAAEAHLKLGEVEKARRCIDWVVQNTSYCGLIPEHLAARQIPVGVTMPSYSQAGFLVALLKQAKQASPG